MSALVDCASAVAARTTSVARASWWLISAIDFDISSAALAATSTLLERVARRLAPRRPYGWWFRSSRRKRRTRSISSPRRCRRRSSTRPRRFRGTRRWPLRRRRGALPGRSSSAFFCSALRRAVMSWCVPIQYAPPGMARLTTAMERPSGSSETKLTSFPAAMISHELGDSISPDRSAGCRIWREAGRCRSAWRRASRCPAADRRFSDSGRCKRRGAPVASNITTPWVMLLSASSSSALAFGPPVDAPAENER